MIFSANRIAGTAIIVAPKPSTNTIVNRMQIITLVECVWCMNEDEVGDRKRGPLEGRRAEVSLPLSPLLSLSRLGAMIVASYHLKANVLRRAGRLYPPEVAVPRFFAVRAQKWVAVQSIRMTLIEAFRR